MKSHLNWKGTLLLASKLSLFKQIPCYFSLTWFGLTVILCVVFYHASQTSLFLGLGEPLQPASLVILLLVPYTDLGIQMCVATPGSLHECLYLNSNLSAAAAHVLAFCTAWSHVSPMCGPSSICTNRQHSHRFNVWNCSHHRSSYFRARLREVHKSMQSSPCPPKADPQSTKMLRISR